MDPTHIGSTPKGRRVHLTDSGGFSACSRRLADVSPLDQCHVKVRDPWCGTCLSRLADDAILDARIAFARSRRSSPLSDIPHSLQALEIAVDALGEIARLGDAMAESLAIDAAAKIKATLPQRGDA